MIDNIEHPFRLISKPQVNTTINLSSTDSDSVIFNIWYRQFYADCEFNNYHSYPFACLINNLLN